ncbi:hypothetical protein GP486_003000 [Trichoglossum hirsutum]|uniref:Uncharacterized protein n=1 Tax=Trichoglossum hirsutum TaxID=265104 RepID=A0A9P8LDR7_9PEZI|nr:hypothetical protein GP486_003000 [Trichoglossum hirsutum]
MDEKVPNSYSFSQEDQANAARVCQNLKQCRLSRENPTYIHLTVELNGHRAAVQIVISPRPHPQFRRQRIFSPLYRYSLCCQSRSSSIEDASRRISQTVQNIIGAYFQLGEWDFSDQDCYSRDLESPDCPSEASCTLIADAALRRYTTPIQGTGMEVGSTRSKGRKRRKTVEPGSENSESSSSNAFEYPNQNGISDLELVLKVTRNIQKGLKAVRSQKIKDNLLPSDSRKRSYMYYAVKLQEAAEKFRQDFQAKKAEFWYTSFLSGSAYLASGSLPARPVELSDDVNLRTTEQSISSLSRWRCVARLANAIVTGLYCTWKEKAFLVIHALAERNCYLTVISNFGFERLHRIATGVVGRMQDLVPEIDTDQPLFDPAFCLSQLMQVDYLAMHKALELPSLDQSPIARVQLGALIATLETNPTHASEPDRDVIGQSSMSSEEVVNATGQSEDSRSGAPFECSGPLAGRNDNDMLENSVHHCIPPLLAEVLPSQSKPTISIGLDAPEKIPELLY